MQPDSEAACRRRQAPGVRGPRLIPKLKRPSAHALKPEDAEQLSRKTFSSFQPLSQNPAKRLCRDCESTINSLHAHIC